jgi:membrane protein implicated in regulation of membrane protease activity
MWSIILLNVKIGHMETIIKADIFFFITSIAVVVFTLSMIVVMFYVTRILKDMKHISETISRESDKLVGDIESIREVVKEEGGKVKNIYDFFISLFNQRQKMRKSKSVKKSEEASN